MSSNRIMAEEPIEKRITRDFASQEDDSNSC